MKKLKNIMSLLLALCIVFSSMVIFANEELITEEMKNINSHKYTGAPVTPVPEHLKKADARGGKILEIPGFDLSKPGADLQAVNSNAEFVDFGDGTGYYLITSNKTSQSNILANQLVEIKPNRKYRMSVLLWTDFDRISTVGGRSESKVVEYDLKVRVCDETQYRIDQVAMGTPDYTNGWQRLEWVWSPGILEYAKYITFQLTMWGVPVNAPEEGVFCLADVVFVEEPETEIVPYAKGEGVTFGGGAGALDMKVESAEETEDNIVVTTTGAIYNFDKTSDTITAWQRIGKERKVETWHSSLPFDGLEILSTTETECVIANEYATFGVQLDSTIFLTPHNSDIDMTVTSEIAGMWNKLAYGYVIALDNYGGFTVMPDIPTGSGRMPRYEILTENLDFAEVPFESEYGWRFKDENGNQYVSDFKTDVSNAKPGWQVKWTISPGERLAITTFPPREYDWENSFKAYTNVYSTTPFGDIKDDSEKRMLGAEVFFDINDKGYTGDYSPYYVQNHFGYERVQEMIDNLQNNGVDALIYTSSYFHRDRQDPSVYINEMKRLRYLYGIDGVYSDGTPTQGEWVNAYIVVRELREVFPDGTIIAHQTGMCNNGGPPLSSPAVFLPMVDTYLTYTLKGELTAAIGFDAVIPTLTWPQYNIANCYGVEKSDYWAYKDSEGNLIELSALDAQMLLLEHNGRARMQGRGATQMAEWEKEYVPRLRALEELWKEKGDDPDFYEKYYAPKARELTREYLSKFGDTESLNETFDNENALDKYGIYDTGASIATIEENNVLKLEGTQLGAQGSVLKRINPVAGPQSIEYDIMIEERGDFEQIIGNSYGNAPVGIAFGRDGKIKFKNIAGNYVNLMPYNRKQWYNVKLEINTDTHLYDVYINGERVLTDVEMDQTAYQLGDIEFKDGGYRSICYIDNILYKNKW